MTPALTDHHVTHGGHSDPHGMVQVPRSADEAQESAILAELLNPVIGFVCYVYVASGVHRQPTQLRSLVVAAEYRQDGGLGLA